MQMLPSTGTTTLFYTQALEILNSHYLDYGTTGRNKTCMLICNWVCLVNVSLREFQRSSFKITFLPLSLEMLIGVQQDYNEGVEQVEQEPHVNHLHVGGLGEVVTHVDQHGSQDQH